MKYNIELLEQKKQEYLEKKKTVKDRFYALQSFENDFLVRFTYDSTAIEGNTLTIEETRNLLLYEKTPDGKTLREIYEQINNKKAFSYIAHEIKKGRDLDEEIICHIHKQLVENIFLGGTYRQNNVYIQGAKHECPDYRQLPELLKKFYVEMKNKNDFCTMPESKITPFETACWIHAEFVGIHPFQDGNGRTSRMIMNYQLMRYDYLPVNIPFDRRMDYYKVLDEYHCTGNINSFISLIFELEMKELDLFLKELT